MSEYPRPGEPYAMGMALCDAMGMTDLVTLNRLRGLSGHAPYEGESFPCTGHAHLAGEHIECTSSAHSVDAVPERPDPIEEPLPEHLERLLRDPLISLPGDRDVHALIRGHLLARPEVATVPRGAYLGLFALLERTELSA